MSRWLLVAALLTCAACSTYEECPTDHVDRCDGNVKIVCDDFSPGPGALLEIPCPRDTYCRMTSSYPVCSISEDDQMGCDEPEMDNCKDNVKILCSGGGDGWPVAVEDCGTALCNIANQRARMCLEATLVTASDPASTCEETCGGESRCGTYVERVDDQFIYTNAILITEDGTRRITTTDPQEPSGCESPPSEGVPDVESMACYCF